METLKFGVFFGFFKYNLYTGTLHFIQWMAFSPLFFIARARGKPGFLLPISGHLWEVWLLDSLANYWIELDFYLYRIFICIRHEYKSNCISQALQGSSHSPRPQTIQKVLEVSCAGPWVGLSWSLQVPSHSEYSGILYVPVVKQSLIYAGEEALPKAFVSKTTFVKLIYMGSEAWQ